MAANEDARPLPIPALVMGCYGSTMFQVQIWEFNLACLAYAAQLEPGLDQLASKHRPSEQAEL